MSPELAARLSDEDWDDIAACDIPVDQAQVFETAAVAREKEALREYFLERVAILAEAGVVETEIEAARLTGMFARNARFLWVSLRSALEETDLLAQLPEAHGVVDALSLGPASVVGAAGWDGG